MTGGYQGSVSGQAVGEADSSNQVFPFTWWRRLFLYHSCARLGDVFNTGQHVFSEVVHLIPGRVSHLLHLPSVFSHPLSALLHIPWSFCWEGVCLVQKTSTRLSPEVAVGHTQS